MKRLVTYFAERSLIVNIITVGILIAGLVNIFSINREAFPKIDYDWVIISTLYPGASPEDIEKHISIPIEDHVREVDGIKEIRSSSVESRSVIAIQLDPDLSNKNKTVADLKDAVEAINTFPKDAEDPVVRELTTSLIPVLEVSIMPNKDISSDSEERSLRKHAKILEDKLREITGVARIDRQGYRDREMIVEVIPRSLADYHIGVNDVINAIAKKNLNFPGGLVKTPKEEVMIRTIGEVDSAAEINKILIRANDQGNWVYVQDVAHVKDSFEEGSIVNRTEGKRSVLLTVLKKESSDIIKLVNDVNKVVEKFKKDYHNNYDIKTSNDMSYFVKRRLNVLVGNAAAGMILVFLTLFFTLGWRISLVTVLGIPLAFCVTFIWMGKAGVTVNLMSMFGLIIVLGMLVDDAIVVAENIYRHLEEGMNLKDAVINGTTEVIMPVAGTILTTIAAFAPLMYMTGIMGKFMWTLPAVVSVALLASWGESMLILPSHIIDLEKHRKKKIVKKEEQQGLHVTISAFYMRCLAFVLKNKYIFCVAITLVFIGSMVFAKKNIKFILFPTGQVERFVVLAEAATGTSLADMNKKIAKIETIIAKIPSKEPQKKGDHKKELDVFISTVGIKRKQPMDPNEKRGSNYATIIVNLTPEEKRDRKADVIIDFVRKESQQFKKEFTKLEFSYVEGGPPVGAPVNVAIKGDDFATLLKIAKEYEAHLKTIKGLKDIKNDFEEGKKELRIIVNEQLASMVGISVYDIARTVRTCFEGTIASTIKKTDEEIDIRVIFPEDRRKTLKSLDSIEVANMQGNLIPLSRVATFMTRNAKGEEIRGISIINRDKWKRAIRVTADIDEHAENITSVKVNDKLMKHFANIEKKYPGVIVDYAGEFQDTKESLQTLLKSFLIAFLVIYIILVIVFRSLGHPLIIMSVIPLTLVGVVWTFYFHGMPISFLALMGLVGLAGVVVNDSIVMVDFIRTNRAKGMAPFEATVNAGGIRLRPIFLTTITTFFGLIPTAYGLGGYDPFLKPMAVSMSWGLMFGTLVTLFVTPILYNVFSDARKIIFGGLKPAESYADIKHDSIDSEMKREIEDEIKAELKKELLQDIDKQNREKIPNVKRRRKKE